MTWLIVSRSERISARCFVPSTLRSVVAASRCVEWLQGKERRRIQCGWLTSENFGYTHQSKLRTLSTQTYKWYGMDAEDVLIVKIPIIRKLYRSLLRY